MSLKKDLSSLITKHGYDDVFTALVQLAGAVIAKREAVKAKRGRKAILSEKIGNKESFLNLMYIYWIVETNRRPNESTLSVCKRIVSAAKKSIFRKHDGERIQRDGVLVGGGLMGKWQVTIKKAATFKAKYQAAKRREKNDPDFREAIEKLFNK